MFIAGIVLRIWQRHLPAVELHKVAPKAAAVLVSEFIMSSYDGQFGYPSGCFRIERADETQVVAQEVLGQGSHFVDILKGLYKAILRISLGCGCLGAYLGFCLAVVLTPMLLYAALTETLLKHLLRSRIVTNLERAKDGTKVSFTLRGPVALLVGQRLERAFHAPALPARVATMAGVSPSGSNGAGTGADRPSGGGGEGGGAEGSGSAADGTGAA
jgi:hypothetical protein